LSFLGITLSGRYVLCLENTILISPSLDLFPQLFEIKSSHRHHYAQILFLRPVKKSLRLN